MGVLGADSSDPGVHGTCLVHSQDSNSDFRRQQVETNRLCRSYDSDSCTGTPFAGIELGWQHRALDTSTGADLPPSIRGRTFRLRIRRVQLRRGAYYPGQVTIASNGHFSLLYELVRFHGLFCLSVLQPNLLSGARNDRHRGRCPPHPVIPGCVSWLCGCGPGDAQVWAILRTQHGHRSHPTTLVSPGFITHSHHPSLAAFYLSFPFRCRL